MRLPPLVLLLAALLPADVLADAIAVDVLARSVTTSRFALQFDYSHQDEIRSLIFKDWSSTQSVGAYEGVSNEFWGQSLRDVDSTGFILPPTQEASDIAVTATAPGQIELTVEQSTLDQPWTSTAYRFFDGQPFFMVTRTIGFAALPETSSYQAYLPRIPFTESYRAVRYRDRAGQLQQRGYAFTGVITNDWDGRWLQQVEISGTKGFAVTVIYDSSTVRTRQFVRGYGPSSFTGWAAAYVPPGGHTINESQRMFVHFSTNVANLGVLDSLWRVLNTTYSVTAAPPARLPVSGLRLAAAPNPAPGVMRLAWSVPRGQAADLAIFDVTGRRVTTLQHGDAAAGEHACEWNGRAASGAALPPGVYLARLATAQSARTIRLVRVR